MSKLRKINRAATFDALMKRSKEEIADQLAGILMLLYSENPNPKSIYGYGWNDSRKVIRDLFETDHWVIREYRK